MAITPLVVTPEGQAGTMTGTDIAQAVNNTISLAEESELKLSSVEDGATADQTKAEIDALGIEATSLTGLTSTPAQIDTSVVGSQQGHTLVPTSSSIELSQGGTTATRISGSSWDEGVYSIAHISGACIASCTATTTGPKGIGISSAAGGRANADFFAYMHNNLQIYVWEQGTDLGSKGTYAAGDEISVHRDAVGRITYLKNNLPFYTSAVTSTAPLHLDAYLYSTTTSLSGLSFQSSPYTLMESWRDEWVTTPGLVVSNSGKTVTKTGAAGWNESIYSKASSNGACSASTILPEATRHVAIGLSTVPAASASISNVDFAIYGTTAGDVVVYEGGVSLGNVGSYSAGDSLQVRRDSVGQVTYLVNGIVIYTSLVSSTGKVSLDSSIYSTGGTLHNLTFNPYN